MKCLKCNGELKSFRENIVTKYFKINKDKTVSKRKINETIEFHNDGLICSECNSVFGYIVDDKGKIDEIWER